MGHDPNAIGEHKEDIAPFQLPDVEIPRSRRWLPKFWRDCGHWNDAVVSSSLLITPAVLSSVAYWRGYTTLVFVLLPVGYCLGFFVGLCLVGLLGAYFSTDS